MALLFRILRSRPGREAGLLNGLCHYASRSVQGQEIPLLVCRTDDPGEFVWMGHLAEETQCAPAPIHMVDSIATELVEPAPAISLRFVGGWHRLPAPPYQIWNVEVRAPVDLAFDAVTELFVPPGGNRGEPLVGRSVFRAIDDASVFIGFVALTWSWLRQYPVPRRAGARGAVTVWRPLSMMYRAETLRGGVEGRPLGFLWKEAAPTSVASSVGVSP